MNRAAIYCITNHVTGKVYIGSSKNVPKRLTVHRWMLQRGRHDNARMQKAWDSDSPSAFSFDVVEYCDQSQLLAREQFWIAKTRSASSRYGYNACPVAGTREGSRQPKGFSAAISAVHKGKPKSAETRAKMSASALGRKKSEEHKERLREAAQRQFADPAARKKAAEYAKLATPYWTGKTLRPETILKLRAAHARRPRGPNGQYLPR